MILLNLQLNYSICFFYFFIKIIYFKLKLYLNSNYTNYLFLGFNFKSYLINFHYSKKEFKYLKIF